MMENPHFVKVEPGKVDEDGWQDSATVTFQCRGDRTSPCHEYPACDCDYYEPGHAEEHPPVAHDECWLQGWFDNNGHEYAGNGADGMEAADDTDDNCVPRNMAAWGQITATYEDDYVSWEFVA
jgi:hypothetical protein